MPYMVALSGYTPLDYCRKQNDYLTINVLLEQLRKDGAFQTFRDLSFFIEKYRPAWKKSYMFNPAILTTNAQKVAKGGILGSIRWGKSMIYSPCQEISTMELNRCLKLNSRNKQMITIETFNIQLNMDVSTNQCQSFLALFKYSQDDMFLNTHIGFIIDDCFSRNWRMIFFFNQVYLAQTLFLTLYEIGESQFTKVLTLCTASIILMIELMQMKVEGTHYFRKMINFINLTGNFLVVFRVFEYIEQFNWIIIIMVYTKGVQSLRIFKEFRHLFNMILSVAYSVIPYLLTLSLSVFLYSFIMISITDNDVSETGYYFLMREEVLRLIGKKNDEDSINDSFA